MQCRLLFFAFLLRPEKDANFFFRSQQHRQHQKPAENTAGFAELYSSIAVTFNNM
jgi:hypothetical protein